MPARPKSRGRGRSPRSKGKRLRNSAELVVLLANPSENGGEAKGRAATDLYEEFHGEASKFIDEYHEPSPRAATLTELGDLIELQVACDAGWKWRVLDFEGKGIKLASSAAGTQLYFIGGDQRLRSFAVFGADKSKEMLDLGEARLIAYRARKQQVNGIASNYEHYFGEETKVYPRLMYDRRGKQPRMYLTGGQYRVEGRGIVN